MWLELLHPLIASRPCEFCQVYDFNEKTGNPRKDHNGEYIKRPDNGRPPCRTRVGCKKGTPEAQKSLNKRNRRAYEHYLECRATGSFPDDALVRRHASIIMQVEREVEEVKQDRAIHRIELALCHAKSRRT